MPALLRSSVDSQPELVKRNGRFSLPRDEAASQHHLLAAVQAHQEKMIEGMRQRGFIYQDGWRIEGPFFHIDFSDDSSPDLGPLGRPDPRDVAAMVRFSKAEQARIARKTTDNNDLVDYVLTAVFLHKGDSRIGRLGGDEIGRPLQSPIIIPKPKKAGKIWTPPLH